MKRTKKQTQRQRGNVLVGGYMPEPLAARLRAVGKTQRRSLSAELTVAVEKHLEGAGK